MKLAENIRKLKYIDLTNNNLKDQFGSEAINMLGKTANVLFLKLGMNPISQKRLNAINMKLRHNKNMRRERKIAKYRNTITNIEGAASKTDEIQESIKLIINDCKNKQSVIEIRKKILDDVKRTEEIKTKRIEIQKNLLDKKLDDLTKELDEFNMKFEDDRITNGKLVEQIDKKDQKIVFEIYKINDSSISFVLQYSEKGERRK